MGPTAIENKRERICFPEIQLAIYRELAAHLQQVEGVKTGLVPQESRQFGYQQSQIGSLWIEYDARSSTASRERVEEILSYYVRLYGSMQRSEIL